MDDQMRYVIRFPYHFPQFSVQFVRTLQTLQTSTKSPRIIRFYYNFMVAFFCNWLSSWCAVSHPPQVATSASDRETTSGVVGIRQPRCREMQTTNQTNYNLIIRGLLRLLGYAIVRHKTVQTVPKTWGVLEVHLTSSPSLWYRAWKIPQRNQEK